jgi:HEAT repeat protein
MFDSARTDSPQRSGSLLVAGALAGRAQQPLADGRTPLQALLALEADAEARGELDTWLLAVANTGSPAALPIAQRLLGHASSAVRGAACVALRGQPDPAALRALLERGLQDIDPMVRQEAVLALSRRSEPAAREAVQLAASTDPDEAVRGRATRALQGNG